MEREYNELITPVSGQKVKVKAWLTGRERREIRSSLLDGVKFSPQVNGDAPVSSDYQINASSIDKMQDIALKTIVVAVDDSTENILDRILDMRDEDYEFIVKEVEKVTNGLDEQSKKK